MTSKIGVQWQIESETVHKYNWLVQPKALMGINSYNLGFWQRLQADNPQSLRIFRFHPNLDEELGISLSEPERLAVESARFLKRRIGYLATTGAITHVLGMNEYVHSFEHGKHPLADRFMSSFIPAVRQEMGLPVIVLNAACGHYAKETADLFPLTLAKLAAETGLPPQQKSFLGFHEYDYPTMDRIHLEDLAKGGGGYWLCGKWKRIMPTVREHYGPIQAIITEAGVDGGVAGKPGKGFRSTAPDLDSAARQYCGNRSLRWYKQLLDEDDAVYAAIIFGLSMYGGWGDFDINGTEVPKFIAQMPSWEPPEPPEPPDDGGNEMSLESIKVFKMKEDGSGHVELKDLAAKEALVYDKYGAAFRRANVAAGKKVYRLTEIWEKTGHSSLISKVLNEDGSPVDKMDVAFYWINAPEPPDPPTQTYAHDWHKNFVHGITNVKGDVGPGMGGGAYHARGEGGPHATWVRDPNIPSDIFEKLGMLAGTFHDHLDHVYQLVTEGEEPGNGEEPEEGMWVETGRTFTPGEPSRIILQPDMEDADKLWDVRGDMKCGSWRLPEPVHPDPETGEFHFGTHYPEEEERTYVAWLYLYEGNERISEEIACDFGPNRRGTYRVQLEWQAEEEPPPPPSDLEERIIYLENEFFALRSAIKRNLQDLISEL